MGREFSLVEANELTVRTAFTTLTIVLVLIAPSVMSLGAQAQAATGQRAILISVPGLRQDLLETFMTRGDLPSISKMLELGSKGTLVGVWPSNAFTAQASLATGTYPKTHGIIGRTYHENNTPLDSLTASVNSTSILPPAEPFWVKAGKNGLNVTIVNFPFSWPPSGNETVVYAADSPLAGSALYTTRSLHVGEMGINLTTADLTLWDYKLRDPREPPPKEAQLVVEGGSETLYILLVDSKLQGVYDKVVVARSRNMSDPVAILTAETPWSVRVQATMGVIKAAYKLRLLELSGDGQNITIYRTEVVPLNGFTQPKVLSSTLVAQSVLPFKGVDLRALFKGWFEEDIYMETLEMAGDWYGNSTLFCSTYTDWNVLVTSFPLIEEVQKAFLGYVTPGHPRYEEAKSSIYLNRIEWAYKRLDTIVASLLTKVDENTVIMLVSPSGSVPVTKVFHVNRWLRDRGWLVTGNDGAVNWSSTKIYYCGDGQLFVNLMGREAQGIIKDSEYDQLVADVLGALVLKPIAFTLTRASMGLIGLGTNRAGDITLIPAPGYALTDALGTNETSILESSPRYLTGELGLSTIHEGSEGFIALTGTHVTVGLIGYASVMDVAPTLVTILGVGTIDRYDGTPLCSAFTVKIAETTVVDRGRILTEGVRLVEKQIAEDQSTIVKVKADSIIYPFVVGLVSVIIGLAAGSAMGRKRLS